MSHQFGAKQARKQLTHDSGLDVGRRGSEGSSVGKDCFEESNLEFRRFRLKIVNNRRLSRLQDCPLLFVALLLQLFQVARDYRFNLRRHLSTNERHEFQKVDFAGFSQRNDLIQLLDLLAVHNDKEAVVLERLKSLRVLILPAQLAPSLQTIAI